MNAIPQPLQGDDNALLAAFLTQVERVPDAIAISGPRGEVRYAGLHAAMSSLAAGLDRHGVAPDDIVAFAAERTPESIALLLAIAANGAAWLPIPPQQSDPRLAELIEQAEPQLIVGDAALRARLPIDAAWVEPGALVSPQTLLDVKPCGALAYVQFTLGRHGRTQGVAMRTRAAVELIDWQRRHARLGKPARTLQFAALDNECAFREIFGTLATGGTLVLAQEAQCRDLSALLNLLCTARVERAFLPAPVVEMLAAVVARRGDAAAPRTLLDVVTAGDQLQFTPELRALFASLHDCVLHIQYGPTRAEPIAPHELSAPAATAHALPAAGPVQPHARSAPGQDGPSSGMWQRSSVAARAAALLRAARNAGLDRGDARTDARRFARHGSG